MTKPPHFCIVKSISTFSAHYFTTLFFVRQPRCKNFSTSLQKAKVPDDIFRIIRHFYCLLLFPDQRAGSFSEDPPEGGSLLP